MNGVPVARGIGLSDDWGISFFDLIEVAAIRRLREVGWTLRLIRAVIESSQDMLDVPRPLVMEGLKNREFLMRLNSGEAEASVRFRGGQQVLIEYRGREWVGIFNRLLTALDPFLETVAYEDEFARRWWPLGKDHRVVVDPDYGFGLPVVAGSGVRTEIIYEQAQALESDVTIADDFNITLEDVRDAVQFEESRTSW